MKNISILIVDDDHRMVKTLKDIFTIKGYNVKGAYSGNEAFEILTEGLFDCVLSDIKMPQMDGAELCRTIHEIRRQELSRILGAPDWIRR